MPEFGIKYTKVTPSKHAEILEHLKHTFFIDEPLTSAVKLCTPGSGHPELEQVVIDTFKDDMSVMALAENGEVAGVALNAWVYKGEVEDAREKLALCPDARFRTIFTFLYDENLKIDLFSQFNVDKYFELRILSVDSKFRGQGIAKRLFQEAENMARQVGAKVIKADCTGAFSQKISESLGFTLAHEKYYDKYLNENGERIIPVQAPHERLQIKYKFLG